MKRLSILIDKRQLDLDLHYGTEKIPEYLCKNCGIMVGSKQSLKHHMVVKHSEKVTTYQCSRCLNTCNRLNNIRCHIKKHPGQTLQKLLRMKSNRFPQSQGQRDRYQPPRPLFLQDHISINQPLPVTA